MSPSRMFSTKYGYGHSLEEALNLLIIFVLPWSKGDNARKTNMNQEIRFFLTNSRVGLEVQYVYLWSRHDAHGPWIYKNLLPSCAYPFILLFSLIPVVQFQGFMYNTHPSPRCLVDTFQCMVVCTYASNQIVDSWNCQYIT